MNLGVFMMPLHPPEKDRTLCFEEDVALAVLADQLGYSELWVGQHHTVAWEPIPANDLFIANVLPRTYLDISEGIPFASSAAWEIIEGAVTMAPLNKICYGSDGYQVPEIMYTSAKLGKQALQDVLNGLVSKTSMRLRCIGSSNLPLSA